jgi:phenylacetate-CoA ligase
MSAAEIFQQASQSKLLSDPYVTKVWSLVQEDLFSRSPDELESLRWELTAECFQFFRRHSPYYADLFYRTGINVHKPTVKDLARLAVPSDMLRGEGQKLFLHPETEEGGETFTSSGTTGREPVHIYRSPIDLAIMIRANTDLFEHVYGGKLQQGKGTALFMAAPELRHRLSFVAFVALTLEYKGIELLYGMDMKEGVEGGKAWTKMDPNMKNILRFMRSKQEPKFFFTAPAGVHLLTERMNSMSAGKRLVQKIATGTPPVRLGKGGVIVTGGGSKGFELPPYDSIVMNALKLFTAQNNSGEDVPTPFMDVLGMTETLTALIDGYGVMGKVPHPLSEVFLVDPLTLEPLEEENREGLVCIFNPFVTSWLECFYPGDMMMMRKAPTFYGKEFTHKRRLTVKEGWNLQRACGSTMEEMMTEGKQ